MSADSLTPEQRSRAETLLELLSDVQVLDLTVLGPLDYELLVAPAAAYDTIYRTDGIEVTALCGHEADQVTVWLRWPVEAPPTWPGIGGPRQ